MELKFGIFNTDQVNRAGFFFSAARLMEAEERHHRERHAKGLPVGAPSYIQHDMHRPLGWSQTLGLMVDSAMVSVRGVMAAAETEEEKAELEALLSRYWEIFHLDGMDSFKGELVEKLRPVTLSNATYLRVEGFVVSQPRLAAEIYPELFCETSSLVDKDGLTDYCALMERTEQIQPGVFYDSQRDLVIFAHRFLRRSLSHLNKLNDYFLKSFDTVAKKHPNLTPRLRLDPDLIGHRATIKDLIELEYWRGPHYSDDIATIPSGVSEHKADERTRYFEGIDRTQVWWKPFETRDVGGLNGKHRTLEIEELIDNPSGGLPGDRFGCRYAHAEFSSDMAAITHFDGAIRAYPAESYLDRIDTSINHAGKRSEYTKLFRFDGALSIENWKRLLSDYFRGNPLVPEYLGAKEVGNNDSVDEQPLILEETGNGGELVGFISLSHGHAPSGVQIRPVYVTLPNNIKIAAVETGCEAVDVFIRDKIDISNITALGTTDGILNLSPLEFGQSGDFPHFMQETIAGLAEALSRDVENGHVSVTAVPLIWQHNEFLVTLTLAGSSALVAQALTRLFSVIDATQAPSEWIDSLTQLIRDLAPTPQNTNKWDGMMRGVLEIPRSDDFQYRMLMPPSLVHDLKVSGVLEGGALPSGDFEGG